jgi:hypothetical protein
MTARHFLHVGVLALGLALAATSAQAQSSGSMAVAPLPAGAAPAAPGPTTADPPSRVGRLAQMDGTVSFHTSDETQWEAATLNYPITSGNSLWTEPQAHAAVDIGGSRVYMDSQTLLDIGTLNDQGFQAQLPQGAVFLRSGGNDGGFEIDTPRGAVTVNQPGHYEIVAGDATHPTTVTALDGSAQIAGPGVNMTVAAGQSASLTGQNPVTGTTGSAQQDPFTSYVAGIEQPYANPAPAQQQVQQQTQQYVSPGMTGYQDPAQQQVQQQTQQSVSPGMTGYQDLAQYGQWQQTPDYGPVWYPQVAVDWAPYRYGHWAYVWPWGWTWIDDSPWGFAPFHYGRWVQIGPAWAWVPGAIVAQPVYSPALVSFFGDVGGIGISLGIGPSVGWVPLGPGEIWYPPYRYSPRYIRNLNITNVNITQITNINIYNNRPIGNFMNRRAATLVSASAMANSQPIGRAFHNIPAANWQGQLARVTSRADVPVKPTLRTAGLTPTVARQFGQTLPANGQIRPQAPGPMVASNNHPGVTLSNGHSLPSFATAQQNAGKAQPQSGRVIVLGNNGQSSGQSFGGFNQQSQKSPKFTAPGPAILPHDNGSTANRGIAALGNAATGNNQNASQRWSFLPPLQKPGQGNAQTGLQSNAFNSLGQPKPQGQSTQGQSHGQAMIVPGDTAQNLKSQGTGQGANNQRLANLPPPQKQPQTSRNNQATTNSLKGYQGTATWNGQQGTQTFKGQQSTATLKGQQGTVQHGSFSQLGGFTFQQHQPQQQQQKVTNRNQLPPPKQPGGN